MGNQKISITSCCYVGQNVQNPNSNYDVEDLKSKHNDNYVGVQTCMVENQMSPLHCGGGTDKQLRAEGLHMLMLTEHQRPNGNIFSPLSNQVSCKFKNQEKHI